MAVEITYDEIRTSSPPNQFDVTYAVTSTTDIPEEIFLMDAINPGTYVRVALVGDFGFPTTPDPLNAAFYRASTMALSFQEYSVAARGQEDVQAAIAELQATYDAGVSSWDGSQSITVP